MWLKGFFEFKYCVVLFYELETADIKEYKYEYILKIIFVLNHHLNKLITGDTNNPTMRKYLFFSVKRYAYMKNCGKQLFVYTQDNILSITGKHEMQIFFFFLQQ